jgi:hypothetical protein
MSLPKPYDVTISPAAAIPVVVAGDSATVNAVGAKGSIRIDSKGTYLAYTFYSDKNQPIPVDRKTFVAPTDAEVAACVSNFNTGFIAFLAARNITGTFAT